MLRAVADALRGRGCPQHLGCRLVPVELTYFQAVVLGVVEGLTEFLPISSTGHLTIAEQLLGLPVDDPAVTAYTAIIQIGAIVATFIYFGRKIARLFMAWVRGLFSARGARGQGLHARLGRHRRLAPRGHRRLPRPRHHLEHAAQPVGGRRSRSSCGAP